MTSSSGLMDADELLKYIKQQKELQLKPVLNFIATKIKEAVDANPYCTSVFVGVEEHLVPAASANLQLAGYEVTLPTKRDERDTKLALTVSWAEAEGDY